MRLLRNQDRSVYGFKLGPLRVELPYRDDDSFAVDHLLDVRWTPMFPRGLRLHFYAWLCARSYCHLEELPDPAGGLYLRCSWCERSPKGCGPRGGGIRGIILEPPLITTLSDIERSKYK